MPISADECVRLLNTRIEQGGKAIMAQVMADVEARIRSYKRAHYEETQRLFNVLSERERARVDEALKRYSNSVTAPTVLHADLFPSPCDQQNVLLACADVAINNFHVFRSQDQFERARSFSVRHLRSKSTAPLACDLPLTTLHGICTVSRT